MSEHNPFVHLHVHSEFSLLDGLSRINDLVARAVELNQPALALTDHGAMYGAIPFYRAARQAGIKPIIGIETYLAARSMHDKDAQLDKDRFHMLLLAHNQTGYLNLLEIATAAQLEGFYYKPRIDRAFMSRYSKGLIATTGCMAGEIPRAIGQGNLQLADKLMGEYVDIFGRERLFVELQEHHIPELTAINKQLIAMAPRFGLENNFLATNDVHYTRAEDAAPHEVLLCIQTSSTVDNPKLSFSDKEYYLKSHAEMARLFGEIPGALSNSLRIAEMCAVNLDFEGYHLPEFDVPEGDTAQSYLRRLCEQGLTWRYGARAASDPALRQRLDNELSIINRMGFDTYFLIVWDLCEWAGRSDSWWERYQDPFPYESYTEWKENDIWWNVRGSGAGSVVAYTLGITSIEPLSNGLIFERFLNPGRVSMPDIDLDYPDDMRHLMVAYTKRRYGEEKVAQIITFGTLGARAAIRDVGRALNLSLPEVDGIARLVPAIPGKPVKIENVLDAGHEFYSAELTERYRREENVKTLLDTARSLEGVARHASSHAAGVIISDRPLQTYVPLNRPTSGEEGLGGVDRVTQWPMEVVDSIGLLKVDFLGLSTLTVMRRAARLIEARYGVKYTMDNIPFDEGHVGPDPSKDPAALFDMLGRGEVAGVFQVEGAGMRRLMMEMQPRRFDHIIAAISLYRPGPMENIPEYIRRMHAALTGEDAVSYHTPELEPILRDTYGVLVYQEQIIRIAADLAGYEPGEADMIRKAVGKKKKDLLDKQRAKFIEGGMANGLSREVLEAIWGDIEFFARYGFNKAHAADYAKVTCQTAFLKAHYPVEYLTAMLSVERDNTEKVRRYFAEAHSLGIDIAPPDVNLSALDFTIEDTAARPLIRFGLGAIKNAGEAALNLIIVDREANGPFKDLQELCDRVDLRRVGKRALEYMIKARVFDAWGTVSQFLEALERIVGESGKTHEATAVGQMSLFGALNGLGAAQLSANLLKPPDALEAVPHKQLLEWEKEALGVHVSEHPLERPLALLQPHTSCEIGEISPLMNGKAVRVAGMISQLRPLTTKKGDPMAFGVLEDLTHKIEVVFFPRTWKEVRADVHVDQVMLITGKVQIKDDQVNLIVDRVTTNLEVAQDADAARAPRRSPPGNRPSYGAANDPNAAAGQRRPAPQFAPPAVETAGFAGAPPPPPNFEADWDAPDAWDAPDDWGAPPAPAPEPAPVKRVAETASALVTETPASPAPIPPTEPIVKTESVVTTRSGKQVKVTGVGEQRRRTVVVEIKPVGNWQEACRRAVKLAGDFQGEDSFSLRLAGQGLAMDFPNQNTAFCDGLVEALERLPGVSRVFESG